MIISGCDWLLFESKLNFQQYGVILRLSFHVGLTSPIEPRSKQNQLVDIPSPCTGYYTIHLRSGLYYGRWVERFLDKLFSIRQGRSSLKYTNYRLCTSSERKVCLRKKSLGFHKYCGQVFLHQTNSWRQKFQKVLPCRRFGGLCLLVVGF
jgi:hypothetical protein